eukprot:9226667-Ditylum_brightwellii.AAC.1
MSTQQQEHDDEGDDDSVLHDVLPAPKGAENTEPVNTPGDNHCGSVSLKDAMVKQIEEINNLHELDGYVNGTHPLAFTARANAADTPTY